MPKGEFLMSIIYHEEFAEFFKAMSAKMQIKSRQYGETWKDKETIGHVPMDKFLKIRLRGEFEEWIRSGDVKELVDVANLCAMIYCREKKKGEI